MRPSLALRVGMLAVDVRILKRNTRGLDRFLCILPIFTRIHLTRSPRSKKIAGQLIFLGTGTSHGVPTIGCDCATCTSTHPKNHRTRCAIVLGLPNGNLLIDTPPELRLQLLREQIGLIHAVAYTHAHADHLFGLDDLRIFPQYLGHALPIYCQEHVERAIRRAFAYAFDPINQSYPAGGVPQLVFHSISGEPFDVLGARLVPIRLLHGRHDVLGFRIGDIAYCTDAKEIPAESLARLENLEVLILDCLRAEPHTTHMNLDEALAAVRRLAPRRTLLTHISHRLEHQHTNATLPPGVELAYDGLTVSLGIVGG
jgi:phosphoribosyl 1,2-cyclic phosphate phosphodiesterase